MAEKLKFFFDKKGDVLDISVGTPKKAISREIGDDIIVRLDSKNNVVGFTIMNFQKRFEKITAEEVVPIEAKFALSEV